MKSLLRLRNNLAALAAGLLFLGSPLPVTAVTPAFIDYQGRVLDGNGAPLAGNSATNYEIQFRIYDAATAGTVIWAEKQLVTVLNGQFSVRLGEGQPIIGSGGSEEGSVGHTSPGLPGAFAAKDRHLGLTVVIPGQTPGEISPRLAFLSSPYAFTAAAAATLKQAPGTQSDLTVGSISYVPAVVSSTSALSGDNSVVLASASSASITTTLPQSAAQKQIVVTKTDSSANPVVVAPPAGGTINGSNASLTLAVTGDSVTLQNTSGNAWWIVNDTRKPANLSLTSLTASGAVTAGSMTTAGALSAGSATLTGALTSGSVTTSGALSAGSATVTGALTAGSFSIPGLTVSGGRVGVGTTSPVSHLHVSGENSKLILHSPETWFTENTIEFRSGFTPLLNPNDITASIVGSPATNGGKLGFFTSDSTGSGALLERMRISPIGNIGIGIDPTRARLEVAAGSSNFNLGWSMFLNSSYAGANSIGGTNMNAPLSIYAHGNIATGGAFVAHSDARMKILEGISDGSKDLSTLCAIEIVDYTHKDKVQKGNGKFKKVIAQQVEGVYPIAVQRSVDVVPDIYAKAKCSGGWIELATDLRKGERVQLILKSGKIEVTEVIEAEAQRFRTSLQNSEAEVFVYGREVKDFRSVDYEAISMLNVSATQQLKKEKDAEVAALEKENAELREKNAAQDKRLAQLEAESEEREARLVAIEKTLLGKDSPTARTVSLKARVAHNSVGNK